MKKKVYLAGPYSKPDPCANTHHMIHTANRLIELGYVPFVPLLTHFWNTVTPQSYEFWMAWDMEWVRDCEIFIRLPGESQGADRELMSATRHGLLIFTGMDAFLKWHYDRAANGEQDEPVH